MTKSRTALAMLLCLAGAPARAQGATAEEALARYKATFAPAGARGCAAPGADGEIVVCGRRTETSPRLPLPMEPATGARVTDGAPRASAERGEAGTERCSTVGPNQQCGGGLPIFGIAATIAKVVAQTVDPDR